MQRIIKPMIRMTNLVLITIVDARTISAGHADSACRTWSENKRLISKRAKRQGSAELRLPLESSSKMTRGLGLGHKFILRVQRTGGTRIPLQRVVAGRMWSCCSRLPKGG